MKKTKKKNAITLIALVITIIMLLLLAGVAIQMALGENGLIAKSLQAQKEQARAELYDTAKLSYTNLNAKALENGQPSPGVELVLSTTEFRGRYDIVGNDITDKKGIVIDTKENVLNAIIGISSGGSTPSTQTLGGSPTPGGSTPLWPKTVAGVTIPEEDKDKMILKLKVRHSMQLIRIGISKLMGANPIEIEYETGKKERIEDLYYPMPQKIYGPGEYIVKIKNISDIEIGGYNEYDIEILQWGKIAEKNEENYIRIYNVSKIYEPEPDKIPITYVHGKFTEIPEWLFDKKVRSTVMSTFNHCTDLTSIPEGLFKNNPNATNFSNTFKDCRGLKSIPEGLFKYNTNATNFWDTFSNCEGLTSIPEGLFKNNVNAINFSDTFAGCVGLKSIPEGLFKYNTNANNFSWIFKSCISLSYIPEKIIEAAKELNTRGGDVSMMFAACTSASNYNSLPGYMR